VTLKMIVGLLEPDAGRVLVDGDDVQELDRNQLAALRGRVGYVFQFAALFDSMTVAENIGLGLVRRGYPPDQIRARVEESLAVVDLSGTENKLPSELSGGMRKRVGIARAIALKPRYILYDEPTTGLDPITAAVMDQLIIRTRDLGVTGLVVTHDMRSAFNVGDRIAMLHQGVIRQAGSTDEVRASDDPVVRPFIEGRPGPALVPPTLRRSAG
jgi:phospholipid/cholesterol/gamma-HCH transport system ATP-binding protein